MDASGFSVIRIEWHFVRGRVFIICKAYVAVTQVIVDEIGESQRVLFGFRNNLGAIGWVGLYYIRIIVIPAFPRPINHVLSVLQLPILHHHVSRPKAL